MKTNVGVFFGGRSVEHEVAVISAVQAMASIDRATYDVTPVYITPDGRMFHSDFMTDINEFKDIPALLKKSREITFVKKDGEFTMIELKGGLFKKPVCTIDIAFPIVHGTNCEDGSLVGWFELLGVPYVTCDVLSAAVGMDKEIFKCVLLQKGIPTLPCVSFYSKEWVNDNENILQKINDNIKYPMIVKPANLGSSVGIRKVEDQNELVDAIEYAMQFATKILVEHAVENLRELNCSVLGDCDEYQASVCEEPIKSGEILSYEDKYMGGTKGAKGMQASQKRIPAELPDEETKRIQFLASETFRVLSCHGVSRVDVIIDRKTRNIYVNEINTIPGSLSFYLWEATGISFDKLMDKLVQLALKRKRESGMKTVSYDQNIFSLGGGGVKGAKGGKLK